MMKQNVFDIFCFKYNFAISLYSDCFDSTNSCDEDDAWFCAKGVLLSDVAKVDTTYCTFCLNFKHSTLSIWIRNRYFNEVYITGCFSNLSYELIHCCFISVAKNIVRSWSIR